MESLVSSLEIRVSLLVLLSVRTFCEHWSVVCIQTQFSPFLLLSVRLRCKVFSNNTPTLTSLSTTTGCGPPALAIFNGQQHHIKKERMCDSTWSYWEGDTAAVCVNLLLESRESEKVPLVQLYQYSRNWKCLKYSESTCIEKSLFLTALPLIGQYKKNIKTADYIAVRL